MSLLAKKTTETEPEMTGSEVLRLRLKTLATRAGASISSVARDINEGLANDANREHALTIARRMAGVDASEDDVRDIAKGLNLSSGTGRTLTVGESQLRDYIDGKIDLDPAIKTQLSKYFYEKNVWFDAERDLLVQPKAPIKLLASNHQGNWVHPSPEVEAAKQAYNKALANYQESIAPRPAPKPQTPEQTNAGRQLRRPGFAP
jgi:hypothetical protein